MLVPPRTIDWSELETQLWYRTPTGSKSLFGCRPTVRARVAPGSLLHWVVSALPCPWVRNSRASGFLWFQAEAVEGNLFGGRPGLESVWGVAVSTFRLWVDGVIDWCCDLGLSLVGPEAKLPVSFWWCWLWAGDWGVSVTFVRSHITFFSLCDEWKHSGCALRLRICSVSSVWGSVCPQVRQVV